MPLVSVVVATHNRATLLRRSLHAACAQTEVDLEIIVIDDGSSDSTRHVVAESGDQRIRYIRNDVREGVSASRNRGIAAACGEWIAFLDDDDLWAPDKLERQIGAAEDSGAKWVYAGDVNIDDQLRVLSGGPPPDPDTVVRLLPHWNPLASGGSNVLVRRDVLACVGTFDTTLRRTEDWDLWIRIARIGAPAWACEPLVAYRFHAGNVAHDPAEIMVEARRVAERHTIPVDFAAMHRRAAWHALRGGRRGQALRHYFHAVVLGDMKSIARAAFTLVHPAVGSDRIFSSLGRDPAWVAKAERWLGAFSVPSSSPLRSAP